ncbi:Shwachman-Bodian-diamond syndrome protein [Multifurca ochricompacta]|uniref:Ribosome maturation protein SDO1 n=1 Tax=Multifurca ochricompacta TaxID=376703 RepID=A0AAD4MBV2_9AGAM|nr:Shwachman-Bodian-diamond syndrome protein [Multifurca ochricompacta]
MPINQPSNQIKLTNVSIVRLKKGGKRYEIACYKNKVQEWRNGVEKDLDEILQISNVFMNVSKGEVAKSNDLKKSFGTDDRDTIAREILSKGDVQVSEKEREHDIAALRREIATLVAEKCADPATQAPYSVGIIEKAMTEAGYSVRANKNAKSQVAECIKILQSDSTLPIERAKMRIRVTIPVANIDGLRAKLLDGIDKLEREETGEEWSGTMLIDPGQFRVITDLLNKTVKGKGRVETLAFNTSAMVGS